MPSKVVKMIVEQRLLIMFFLGHLVLYLNRKYNDMILKSKRYKSYKSKVSPLVSALLTYTQILLLGFMSSQANVAI